MINYMIEVLNSPAVGEVRLARELTTKYSVITD